MYSTRDEQLKSDKKQVNSDCFLQHKGEKIALSETEYQTIQEVLKLKRKGKTVTLTIGAASQIVSHDKYMTTQEAADFLNMSRPYLIKILENEEIPYIKVGNRRKILTEEIMRYQQQRDKNRRQTMKNFSQGLKEDGFYKRNVQQDFVKVNLLLVIILMTLYQRILLLYFIKKALESKLYG